MKLLKNIPSDHPNLRNRRIYLQKIGVSPSQLVSAEIVHKNKVAVVSKKDTGKIIRGVDGLITGTGDKGVYLSITSADCLPVFLFDPQKKVVGMIHAGWRSLANNILSNTIEKMKSLGSIPKNILAGIGPAICQKHYEVGSEVAEKFENYPQTIKRDDDKIYLDIKEIAKLQLSELGIRRENIEISPKCTFEFPEKYFSARRGRKKDQPKADRPRAAVEAMIAVIGIKK